MASVIVKSEALRKAAKDFHYLLNRGYPRKPSLELVGNRYSLSSAERHLLHRGIFSDSDARTRKERKVSLRAVHNKDLAIDGYNIIITVESALSDQPLILSNDGFIRDISGLSGNFRKTKITDEAIHLILNVLKEAKPRHTLFLFDAPISKSGLLAREIRDILGSEELSGDALAIRVPEKVLIGFEGIVSTSDTAIIGLSPRVLDLAGHIIRNRVKPGSLFRLKV
jgi:hypothetical protein